MRSIKSVQLVIFLGCFLFPRMLKCELASIISRGAANTQPGINPDLEDKSTDAMIQHAQVGLDKLFEKLFGIRPSSYRERLLELNGNPKKDGLLNHNLEKFLFSELYRSKLASGYPPAAVETTVNGGHISGRPLPRSAETDYLNNWWSHDAEIQPNSFETQDEPVFIPYASLGVLPSMNQFFQCARENQKALLKIEQAGE